MWRAPRLIKSLIMAIPSQSMKETFFKSILSLSPSSSTDAAFFGRRFRERAFAVIGEAIEPPQRPPAVHRFRVLPAARQQSHVFEPAERAVQRSMGSKTLAVAAVRERLGELESVELATQPPRGGADVNFEWEERAGSSFHVRHYTHISAY